MPNWFTEMFSDLITTVSNSYHGTPLYMAPEILIKNESGSFPSNVWAIGCILIELYKEEIVWELGVHEYSFRCV